MLEYLLLDGEGWELSAKLDKNEMISSRPIGGDAVTAIIESLSNSSVMSFDDHVREVKEAKIDFTKKKVLLIACSAG